METQATITPQVDVYARITANIIEQLSNGIVPWREPWTQAGLPTNLVNQKPYRGINAFILASQKHERNLFLSYKQLQSIGGKVKKDEKGYQVIFWDYSKTESGKTPPVLLTYAVFNVSQCEQIPDKYLSVVENLDFDPLASCEEIVKQMPNLPLLKAAKGEHSFYDPLKDFVSIPKQAYPSTEAYYFDLFRSLMHSTGHHSRLGRPDLIQMAEYGWGACTREELIAEIGAFYLQSFTGITQSYNVLTTANDWMEKLAGDTRLIFSAASAAQKAVDFILNAKGDAEDKEMGA